MKFGIVGYGSYIPKMRIKTEDIALANGQNPSKIKSGIMVNEKSFASKDEDAITMGVEATLNALLRAKIDKYKIGAIYFGSESHPYAVKPSATVVGNAIGLDDFYTAADLEFACKSGTAAIVVSAGLVKSKMVEYAIAIGADKAKASKGDILEYSASAGGASFILGSPENEIVATIDKIVSLSSNTPDFWRRSLEKYPQHLGRFTGEPSYFAHISKVVEKILDEEDMKPSDFDYVVFHQPNGAFPRSIGKRLGFSSKQVEVGIFADNIGNCYSTSTLLGLTLVLDCAEPFQKILVVSYGSGSGCDAMILTTTEVLSLKQKLAKTTKEYIQSKSYINYFDSLNNI